MARLIRVAPGVDVGLRRVRAGRGFRYLDDRGGAVSARDVRRIRALAIPPAWGDVWIAADPRAHIQAVGIDDAGRRQYIYHADWTRKRDHYKYARALRLAEMMPRARARVTLALRSGIADRERTLAVAFRLLDVAALRVGSERYLQRHGSKGLTTLQRRDAVVTGTSVRLAFTAKGGHRAIVEVEDAELAAVIDELRSGRARSSLLWYWNGRRQRRVVASEMNAYLRELCGGPVTAKDFRTLRGTIAAAEALARLGAPASPRESDAATTLAVRAAADLLGNTPAVARRSYVDPRVFARYAHGELLDLRIAPETAIRRLLDAPEHG